MLFQVAPIDPLTRGLKASFALLMFLFMPPVAPIDPMTRGLKDKLPASEDNSSYSVAPIDPITRGLKVFLFIPYLLDLFANCTNLYFTRQVKGLERLEKLRQEFISFL